MIYVVLGMHKSGTTLLSNILHNSGINMVEDYRADFNYDQNTTKGERGSTTEINFYLMNTDPKQLSIYRKQINRNHRNISGIIKNLTRNLDKSYKDWGFKDPQSCITYNQIWQKYLPEHKIICIFRNPYEIWNRYKIIDGKTNVLKKILTFPVRLFRAWHFIDAWIIHNQEIIKAVKKGNSKDYFITSYENLLFDDNVFKELENFVGKELVDVRKKDMYRNREKKNKIISNMNLLYSRIRRRRMNVILKRLKDLQ